MKKHFNITKSYNIEELAGKNAIVEKIMLQDSEGKSFSVVLIVPKKLICPIVIIPPGLGATKENSSKTKLIPFFLQNNTGVLVFDAYGHGESEGNIFDYTMSKLADEMKQIVKFLDTRGYKNIILYGSSVPAFATIICAVNFKKNVRKLVLQSPILDLKQYMFKVRGKNGLNKYETRGYFIHPGHIGRRRIGYGYYLDMKKYNLYKDYMPKITAKTMIIAAGKDRYLNIKDIKKISVLIKNSSFHSIKGADHLYSDSDSRAELNKLVISFITDKEK